MDQLSNLMGLEGLTGAGVSDFTQNPFTEKGWSVQLNNNNNLRDATALNNLAFPFPTANGPPSPSPNPLFLRCLAPASFPLIRPAFIELDILSKHVVG